MKDNKSAFNSIEYDEQITKTLPYYEDFHCQVIDLVKAMNYSKINWLDTGCGTGKTAYKALKELYGIDINFTLCDISNEMLNIAKSRFTNTEIIFRNISSQELDYDEKFDVVTAIQCHHYLSQEERQIAIRKCFNALSENGIFITFENICYKNKSADLLALRRWENYMISNGKTQQEVAKHIERRGKEVFPITVEEHLNLLKSIGFKYVELLWFSYMQAGFFAVK